MESYRGGCQELGRGADAGLLEEDFGRREMVQNQTETVLAQQCEGRKCHFKVAQSVVCEFHLNKQF